jgi:hypothetical protein
MRERAVATARQDGSHEPPVAGEGRVADGVHAGVDAMQPAGGDAVSHRGAAQAALEELPERDDAVLGERELRDQELARGVM